jgi:hypothetical protein
VADAHTDQISRGNVQVLADRLSLDGWLLMPTKGNTAPEVSIDLEELAQAVLRSVSIQSCWTAPVVEAEGG